MNEIFSLCVTVLRWLAEVTGMSYQAVNVWIFCIIWPVVTVVLIMMVRQRGKEIRRMSHNITMLRLRMPRTGIGDKSTRCRYCGEVTGHTPSCPNDPETWKKLKEVIASSC